jgi:hypothetical protein
MAGPSALLLAAEVTSRLPFQVSKTLSLEFLPNNLQSCLPVPELTETVLAVFPKNA